MYLSNLKLWNFRKFGADEPIDLNKANLNLNFNSNLNVIIGENDSGKSAIIDAIKIVLKTHSYDYIRIDDSDFHNNSDRFRIELKFVGLTALEAKNFTEWLGWEIIASEHKSYLRIIYDVIKSNGRILPSDVKAGVDDIGFPLTAEAREFLKVTYLKPLRDAENELAAKKNSRLCQILLGDIAFKGKQNDHELVKIFKKFNSSLEKYFKGEDLIIENEDGTSVTFTPEEGKKIKLKIDGYIKKFYGDDYETHFEASTDDIKSLLEKLSLKLFGESNPGLGTLNRLCMAAELLHLDKDEWSGIKLGLIEELEAHLHPQAQMQVIEALQNQDRIQLILTSHSTSLASKLKLENLIFCNNVNAFPLGVEYTKLEDGDYTFLERFLDATKANLFFARGVILVEGWAEEILLPALSRKAGINLTGKSVSIVNIGNTAFLRYSKIFLRKDLPKMTLPVSIITDVDVREYEKVPKLDAGGAVLKDTNGKVIYEYVKLDTTRVNADTAVKVAELNTEYSKDNVKAFLGPNWTLEYCLYKSSLLTSLFQEVVKEVHSGTDWDTDFEKALAEKLINKGFNKTEVAYRMANKLDEDGLLDTPLILIDKNNTTDSISYLLKAIKYASNV